MQSPFNLDMPLTPLAPLAGGNGGLPPVTDTRPFKTGGNGSNNAPQPQARNNQVPVISRLTYPKPRAWVEKRIALATRHHAKFNAMRRAFKADLAAWVESQPGYCPIRAAQEAHLSKIRRAFRNRNMGVQP